MTLVNRVSIFFLAAVALLLAIYSALIFSMARFYLYHRFDEQLLAARNALVAAVEVEPDDVKFEPSDHTIHLGVEADIDDIRWAIFDERERPVALSRNLQSPEVAESMPLLEFARRDRSEDVSLDRPRGWRILQHHFAAVAPKPESARNVDERAALVVTVARSTADLETNLRNLAIALSALGAVAWSLAALAGRAYCRRALQPVRAMAAQARELRSSAADWRLPASGTNDELAELSGAFNQLLDRLHAALDRQQRFAGDAAHQLRTPLTVLQGNVDVALRRERTADDYRATLGVVGESTAELRAIVDSLLFLARAEGDAPAADAAELDLGEWLTKHADRWRDHPRGGDLRWESAPPVIVIASPTLLAPLLDNLIDNALRYSSPGAPVTIALARAARSATLSVRDRGPGIPAAEREAIFAPFFRSPSARASGSSGTGLGLAIAARIATTLGGTLTCDSTLGEGSIFTLTLSTANH